MDTGTPIDCFNPVLGFLSVSTIREFNVKNRNNLFQSRAGFSECLDYRSARCPTPLELFQSRAGFSECLDRLTVTTLPYSLICFNPVLGFLSVSTGGEYTVIGVKSLSQCSKSNPRYVDWGCTET